MDLNDIREDTQYIHMPYSKFLLPIPEWNCWGRNAQRILTSHIQKTKISPQKCKYLKPQQTSSYKMHLLGTFSKILVSSFSWKTMFLSKSSVQIFISLLLLLCISDRPGQNFEIWPCRISGKQDIWYPDKFYAWNPVISWITNPVSGLFRVTGQFDFRFIPSYMGAPGKQMEKIFFS